MAVYRKKKVETSRDFGREGSSRRSRSRSGRSRVQAGSERCAHPARKTDRDSHTDGNFSPTPRKKKPDWALVCMMGVVVAGFGWLYSQKNSSSPADTADFEQKKSLFTLEERIQQKQKNLKLQRDLQSQEALEEKFKPPVGTIDPAEPDVSPLDMGLRFSNEKAIESVFQDLDVKPFENDLNADPEEEIRRQIAQREWFGEHSEKSSDQEQKEFIKRFVKIANEQGYDVNFTEDMQVILVPREPDKEELEEEEFEEVQIDWN